MSGNNADTDTHHSKTSKMQLQQQLSQQQQELLQQLQLLQHQYFIHHGINLHQQFLGHKQKSYPLNGGKANSFGQQHLITCYTKEKSD